MRLIDGNALYEKTAEWEAQALHMVQNTMHDEDTTEWKRWSAILKERSAFKFDVADAPTIDAVPVVRCRECRYYEIAKLRKDGEDDHRYKPSVCVLGKYAEYRKPEWYCADGKRKGDEKDATVD